MGIILAIDQGTTSSRALLFDATRRVIATASRRLAQHLPRPGRVEHDPEDIWQTTLACCRQALAAGGVDAADIAAIGIANQRETVLVWERASGRPIHRAIGWQDRRSHRACRQLMKDGHAPLLARRTGLLADPYFSATKIAWLLDNVEGARAAAERGALAFGTVDSFLLWRLTGGQVHATDATNASRTMLYDIHACRWDEELCALLRVPIAMLPEVLESSARFGTTAAGVLGAPVAIGGVAGDQQAAAIGQGCFQPGMAKATYGTGAFVLLNTGQTVPAADATRQSLVATLAWRLDGRAAYALEGSIFAAGAVVEWLCDKLAIASGVDEIEALAQTAASDHGVHLVPAFAGLGAPWWDAAARGQISGLSYASGRAEIARAALESVGHGSRDLLQAMAAAWGGAIPTLRADGGMAASDWTMQFLADIAAIAVERPAVVEATALGAAWLAGRQAGLWPEMADFAAAWKAEKHFTPTMDASEANRRHAGWQAAVRRALATGARPEKET